MIVAFHEDSEIAKDVLAFLRGRFLSKVAVDDKGCWLWQAGISSNGYGSFWNIDTTYPAHRASYDLFKGRIPEGLQIDHLCKVRRCVNPEHLEAVTARENVWRSDSPWGLNARKSTCIRGHEFEPDVLPNGQRWCRTCRDDQRRINARRYYQKHREKIRAYSNERRSRGLSS